MFSNRRMPWTLASLLSESSRAAQFHPAGIIFSILGAILVLFLWYKLKLHLLAG
jgi:uncharacterized membrane protein YeaQ/YmgE (transglycosylase-associated protein family)